MASAAVAAQAGPVTVAGRLDLHPPETTSAPSSHTHNEGGHLRDACPPRRHRPRRHPAATVETAGLPRGELIRRGLGTPARFARRGFSGSSLSPGTSGRRPAPSRDAGHGPRAAPAARRVRSQKPASAAAPIAAMSSAIQSSPRRDDQRRGRRKGRRQCDRRQGRRVGAGTAVARPPQILNNGPEDREGGRNGERSAARR